MKNYWARCKILESFLLQVVFSHIMELLNCVEQVCILCKESKDTVSCRCT